MNKKPWFGILIVGASLVVGCGEEGGRNSSEQQRARVASLAEETKYQDWEALKMSNGLITVTTVP